MKKFLLLVIVLLGYAIVVAAQPFRKEIDAFLKADSVQQPAKGQILFVGSSSFTFWKDVQDYFPGYPILNRGFGGSSLPDLIRYAEEVIIPNQPKQIILYCGENDLADSTRPGPKTVFKRFKTLMGIIRERLGKVPVVFVSIKPSPSRWQLEAAMVATNKRIARYSKHHRALSYVDVHSPMLQPDGTVRAELFKEDRLHMNAQGYAIWKTVLAPVLLR